HVGCVTRPAIALRSIPRLSVEWLIRRDLDQRSIFRHRFLNTLNGYGLCLDAELCAARADSGLESLRLCFQFCDCCPLVDIRILFSIRIKNEVRQFRSSRLKLFEESTV